jgi:hypothetical protein
MRQYNSLLVTLLLLVFGVVGCKKDENRVVLLGGTAPQLTAPAFSNRALLSDSKNDVAIKLTWTNPNYIFNTGVSSQNVAYALEFDTTGANFTNPAKQTISVSNDLSRSFTQAELNGVLGKMGLEALKPHNIEVRVISSINNTVPLTSNVVKFASITPYEDFAVPAPSTNALYITGAATPASWQAGVAGETVPANQRFIQKSRSLFEIPRLFLNGGQSYLLLPQYGSWAVKYGGIRGNNENNVMEDDFKVGGSDLKAPPESGNYKIEVNFQTGRFKLTKL